MARLIHFTIAAPALPDSLNTDYIAEANWCTPVDDIASIQRALHHLFEKKIARKHITIIDDNAKTTLSGLAQITFDSNGRPTLVRSPVDVSFDANIDLEKLISPLHATRACQMLIEAQMRNDSSKSPRMREALTAALSAFGLPRHYPEDVRLRSHENH